MAHSTIYLTNGTEVKKAPVGFSWTVFFFGFFPPLFRGDWIWFAVLLLLGLLFWWIPAIVVAFFYNKLYIKSLFEKGYKIHDSSQITDEQLKNYLGYVNLPGK